MDGNCAPASPRDSVITRASLVVCLNGRQTHGVELVCLYWRHWIDVMNSSITKHTVQSRAAAAGCERPSPRSATSTSTHRMHAVGDVCFVRDVDCSIWDQMNTLLRPEANNNSVANTTQQRAWRNAFMTTSRCRVANIAPHDAFNAGLYSFDRVDSWVDRYNRFVTRPIDSPCRS